MHGDMFESRCTLNKTIPGLFIVRYKITWKPTSCGFIQKALLRIKRKEAYRKVLGKQTFKTMSISLLGIIFLKQSRELLNVRKYDILLVKKQAYPKHVIDKDFKT